MDVTEPWVTLGSDDTHDYRKQARDWAKALKDKEAREYAAEAAERLLRKGFKLPKLQEVKIKPMRGSATIADYTPPLSFDIDMGTIRINTHPYIKAHGGYRALGQRSVESGWSAQDNSVLHELAHMLDYWAKHKYPRGVKEQVGDRFDKLEQDDVKKHVSKYAATSAAEFRAELISGILAGKVYPEEMLKAAYLDTYRENKGMDDIYLMGSGKKANTSATEQKFGQMMEVLFHQEGGSLRIEVIGQEKVQDFIRSHAQVLDNAVKFEPMSQTMRHRLERSNYIFSGMKTFHELNEAFPSLLNPDGTRKPFEEFLNDVQKIDRTYNHNYLRAEYNFAQAAGSMAAKWERFQQDGDRYNLQYRTANDDHVREEHAALHGVTLPPSDSFWAEYYPPNGWNCRCTVVQVRKSKYPVTPHDEAMALGEAATGKDPKGIFHFNPGIEQKAFPDYNPYTIKRCRDCDLAKGKGADGSPVGNKLVFVPENELCAACRIVRSLANADAKQTRKQAKPLQGTSINTSKFPHPINISRASITEWTNQPNKHYQEKNKMLLRINEVFEDKECEYLGPAPAHKPKERLVQAHIFSTKVQGEEQCIIVWEWDWGEFVLHSISDNPEEVKKYIKKK